MTNFSLEAILEELQRRKTYGGWKERFFNTRTTRRDYGKHWEFFDAGAKFNTRLFTAGNQVGKSVTCATELVMHLTGDYHDDWKGRRFAEPINAWIVGRTSELVRQTVQPLLLGQTPNFGTGLIPRDTLDLSTLTDAKKASTGISTFRVLHKSGGFSTVSLKSGEQGREAFQAATLDLVWCDEEIPYDVFNECQVRLMVKKGLMMYSFTPLKGTSEVITSFMVDGTFQEGDVGSGRYVVRCSMYDVPHQTKESIEQLIASTPPYLRDARVHGIPSLGAGAIYPVPECEFVIPAFAIPDHWPRMYGMDVGAKTAAIWLAHDRDNKQWHAYAEYYKEREEPSIHTTSIKLRGEWIPGAIDPASRGRSQIDGQQLMQMYEELGLHLTKAVNAVEAGLYTVWEMLSTDQLKVHDTCTGLRQEIKAYHRDERGHVVKKNDHRVDSLRYAVMTRDIAITKPVNKQPFTGLPTHRRNF